MMIDDDSDDRSQAVISSVSPIPHDTSYCRMIGSFQEWLKSALYTANKFEHNEITLIGC